MPGLLSSIDSASRSLQAYRLGAEITGHNLANANNRTYSRQRVELQAAPPVVTGAGSIGTGVEVAAVTQVRDQLLEKQLLAENAVRSGLEARKSILEFTEASLGQTLGDQAARASGADSLGGNPSSLGDRLSDLFNAFQGLSTSPTSVAERQTVTATAQGVAEQFRQIQRRLNDLQAGLEKEVGSDVASANQLLEGIADLNRRIAAVEAGGKSPASDLRDLRAKALADLAELTDVTTSENPEGTLDVLLDGTALVTGVEVSDQIQVLTDGGGHLTLQAAGGGQPIRVDAGRIGGKLKTIAGQLMPLRESQDRLASALIEKVNALHRGGFDLQGATGLDFFEGSDARSIRLNQALVDDPSRIQASGNAQTSGDNQVALGIARLNHEGLQEFGGRTFVEENATVVVGLGQDLHSVNQQLANQDVIERLLQRQRDAVSGVSLDEELTNLIKYQRSFEASGRLIATLDELLATVVNLGR